MGMTVMVKRLEGWVAVLALVEGVTETGIRTEMVALLPQWTTLSGGDRDHGSGSVMAVVMSVRVTHWEPRCLADGKATPLSLLCSCPSVHRNILQ